MKNKHLQHVHTSVLPIGNVATVQYLGTTVTNRNLIQEEVKRGFNSGNAS
jgi:hypothetical protein